MRKRTGITTIFSGFRSSERQLKLILDNFAGLPIVKKLKAIKNLTFLVNAPEDVWSCHYYESLIPLSAVFVSLLTTRICGDALER